jgi:hypothetical protein
MSKSNEAWDLFDQIVDVDQSDPWVSVDGRRNFVPDLACLEQLLGVPLRLGMSTQSGIPAKAVDVWLAFELRRAGFGADEVWPRATRPRVLPREVGLLIDSLPRAMKEELWARVESGKVGPAVSADANVLGKAYNKQVDVVIAQWARGPELLISSKRMDSSIANNAFNRIEESYGDAHNLRGRHPLAAIGYVLVLRSTAFTEAPAAVERLIDLVGKLASDDGGYDSTCVVVAQWENPGEELRPDVRVVEDLIPENLRIGPFIEDMIRLVLARTPVDAHVRPRELLTGMELAVQEHEGH